MSKRSKTSQRKRAERRAERKSRNIKKEQDNRIKAVKSGRIIKEKHGQGQYSLEYCQKTYDALRKLIYFNGPDDTKSYINKIRKYKDIILDLIIYWKRSHDNSFSKKYQSSLPDDEKLGYPLSSVKYDYLLHFLRDYYSYIETGKIDNTP
jgi:hypothetical protein